MNISDTLKGESVSNSEPRPKTDYVHLYLAFARNKDGVDKVACRRKVIVDAETDFRIFEAELKALGGTWRIHRTVNKRDVQKARIWMLHKLIDNPEYASCIDSIWRTALLQPHCKATEYFLLDIDTTNMEELDRAESLIPKHHLIHIFVTPEGYHHITAPFDTREICKLPYVTLNRDGYYFMKKIGDSVEKDI